MTDAQILQKLFELAWEHGCTTFPRADIGEQSQYISFSSPVLPNRAYILHPNAIFFDRAPTALIPSLCRAAKMNNRGELEISLWEQERHHEYIKLDSEDCIFCKLITLPESERIPWLGKTFLEQE